MRTVSASDERGAMVRAQRKTAARSAVTAIAPARTRAWSSPARTPARWAIASASAGGRLRQGQRVWNAKSLQIRGQATLETVDGIPGEYIEAASKSLDAEQRAEFEKQVGSVYDQMVRISIEPGWARFYDFGTGRLPGFLTKLVSGR